MSAMGAEQRKELGDGLHGLVDFQPKHDRMQSGNEVYGQTNVRERNR